MWIMSFQELGRSPKLVDLALRLDCHKLTAIGLLHSLWWWAVDNAPDGDISKFAPQVVAVSVGWDGDGEAMMAALEAARFVDVDTDGHRHIHDWMDGAGQTVERIEAKKEYHREYMREYRQNGNKGTRRASREVSREYSREDPVKHMYSNMNRDNKREDSSSSCMEGNNVEGRDNPHIAESGKPNSAPGDDAPSPAPSPTRPTPARDGKPPRAMKGETPEAFHARYMAWAKAVLAGIWTQYHEQWAMDYPALDLAQEFRNALNWLLGNPDQRKIKLMAFITRWLRNNQSRANGKGGGFKTAAQQKHENNYNAYQAFMAKPMEDGDEEVGV